MATYSEVCPHCDTKIALAVYGVLQIPTGHSAVFVACPNCKMPSMFFVATRDRESFHSHASSGVNLNQFVAQTVQVYPEGSGNTAPDFIPPEVGRVFLQSRGSHRRGDMDLAAMGYRRSVELALKAADPSIKGQLGPRTDALTARQVLSGSMKDWADHVRLLGNEANHDPPEPTADTVEDLYLFTETLLEFLFTMPERVKMRRTATDAGKAGAAGRATAAAPNVDS